MATIDQEWKDAMVEAHNRVRAAHGAPPVQWCEEMFASADRQAYDNAAAQTIAHGNMDNQYVATKNPCVVNPTRQFFAGLSLTSPTPH